MLGYCNDDDPLLKPERDGAGPISAVRFPLTRLTAALPGRGVPNEGRPFWPSKVV
jgi:hypothetical protein